VRAQELGAPIHEVVKSRGARIAVVSREREDCWIRNPICISCIQEFGGYEDLFLTVEVMKCQEWGTKEHVEEP